MGFHLRRSNMTMDYLTVKTDKLASDPGVYVAGVGAIIRYWQQCGGMPRGAFEE